MSTPTPTPTPTPRTYAAKIKSGFAAIPDGFYDHARGLETELAALAAECDQLRDELAKERARLDWLEENAGDIQRYNSSRHIWFAHQNIRAAIDAAMKEEAK